MITSEKFQLVKETTGFLLNYNNFKDFYEIIATDLRSRQAADVDPSEIEQTEFTGNLDQDGNTLIISLLKKQRKLFQFFTRKCKSIVNVFECVPQFILILYNISTK